ncbi:MAG TPA: ferrochelatase [Actinomycetota bacterium]|nr:ferrochelatase [Actinomycetota bacterium]
MTTGVLLMAYGSPNSIEEIEPYLRDIRGDRPIRDGLLEDLIRRYSAVGVPSPLLDVTLAQAAGIERALSDDGDYRVFVGMKHWEPWIRQAVEEIDASSVRRVIGVAAAPHYSAMSIGGYAGRVERAMKETGARFTFRMIESWWEQPGYSALVADNLRETMHGWDPADPATHVFFTAHSLPERILAAGDPYRDQLLASAERIAQRAGIRHWSFAFQSASQTGEPWLGPDLLDALSIFAGDGGRRAAVAPIGFVADHLEILFDIDIEAVEAAGRLGVELRRIPSPNADPRLCRAIADAVLAEEASWRVAS